MNFDLSQIGRVYDYLAANTQIFLDAGLLVYSLYTIILNFNIGITHVAFRLIGYIASFFISRLLTIKAATYLKITEPMSIIFLGMAIFVLLSYIIYHQIQFFFAGSRSLLDSLLGAVYGMGEVLLMVAIINSCAIYAHENGFALPDTILEANQKKPRSPTTPNSITYFVLSFVAKYTKVMVEKDKFVGAVNWMKTQFGIPQEVPIAPTTEVSTKKTSS